MAEYPAMPLWTDAYLGDTTHLTTTEHGAYLLILMAIWRSKDGRINGSDKMLARYARLNAGQWNRIKPNLMPFFDVIEDGTTLWITQGRLTRELKAVRRRSANASNSSRSRWLKDNETGDANALRTHCERNATIPITNTTNKQTPITNSAHGALGFDILVLLDEKALSAAKKAAVGWDIYHLAKIYNESAKGREKPNNPTGAFIGWLRSYTKGNPPS